MSTFKSWSDCVTAWTQYMDFKEKKKKVFHIHIHTMQSDCWALTFFRKAYIT